MPWKHVLVLGGTGEARQLCDILSRDPDLKVTLSLAGRTRSPAATNVGCRTGGFGGLSGLIQYLTDYQVDVLVDATHPYAVKMGANAVRAAEELGIPLLRIERPPWTPGAGDHWIDCADRDTLVETVIAHGLHVFWTLGGADTQALAALKNIRVTLRATDPPELPDDHAHIDVLLDRGPFNIEEERSLLLSRKIDILASRNSGGTATSPKLRAARDLGLPVAMLARPKRPTTSDTIMSATVETVEDAGKWIDRRKRDDVPVRAQS